MKQCPCNAKSAINSLSSSGRCRTRKCQARLPDTGGAGGGGAGAAGIAAAAATVGAAAAVAAAAAGAGGSVAAAAAAGGGAGAAAAACCSWCGCCCMLLWWFGPMWPKYAFGDQKCLIRNQDMPFGNPPHHGTKTCGLLKKYRFFNFLAFYGSKSSVLGQKPVVLSVLDRV